MPEAVKVFAETGDFSKTRKIQKDILTAYDKDFAKHAKNHYLLAKLRLLWNNIPAQLAKENKKFIYKSLRAGTNTKAKSLKVYRDAFKPEKSYRVSLVEWRPGSDMEDVPLYAISSIAAEIDDGNCITFDQL